MPLPRRPFSVDEELGKKDDDHRPREKPLRMIIPWISSRPRRFFIIVAFVYFLYIFFKNIPVDPPPRARLYNPELREDKAAWPRPPPSDPSIIVPQGPPPRDKAIEDTKENEEDHYYEGKIYLGALAASLHRTPMLDTKPAVIFVGSNLKSVSDLIPLACQMARWKANVVHFVFVGRDDVSIRGLQAVNAVDDENCPVLWHDGRPNYAPWSTDTRMERAVLIGLIRLQDLVHPHVVITQGELWEDAFLWKGVTEWVQGTGVSHLALPTAARNVLWISSLDSSSLKAWNDVDIEMVIHAPGESSGSMIRLIQSLEKADYLGSTPGLTIELPWNVDSELLDYLQKMSWPPGTSGKPTLRRRVRTHMTSAESSIKTVEAFYPHNPSASHVLLLSPQTELSPSFYHYLKYATLYYKQTATSEKTPSTLLGISLELPSTKPTAGDVPFTYSASPSLAPSQGNVKEPDNKAMPHMLWQAPNSNAALYFGEKWAEFHSFLSKRLTVQDIKPDFASHEKLISKRYPAFMEYLLEMTRANGYYMLYPSFASKGTLTLVTVHDDLYQPPEEYLTDASSSRETGEPKGNPNLNQLRESSRDGSGKVSGFVKKALNADWTLNPFLNQFPLGLPQASLLDLLSFNGEILSNEESRRNTEQYAKQFRVRYGGCHDDTQDLNADILRDKDLFCLE